MGSDSVPVLFVTANVGSIFEDPQNLLKIWVQQFLSTVKEVQPCFLALHCQEVGGKNYQQSMKHVGEFVRMLMSSDELVQYGKVRVYLDEDYTSAERFTALGNLYFAHNSLKNIQIWDYRESKFCPVESKEVHSGNIERVSTKEKAKFPQEYFPENRYTRKGFMRTRWNVCGTDFDLINIHLFHDDSNFIAMDSSPSIYSTNRYNALAYTLRRLSSVEYSNIPFFIFGDFNFRLDTKGIVKKLTESTSPVQIKNDKNGEIEQILYKDPENENKVILKLGKKVFDMYDHEGVISHSLEWLMESDKELDRFHDELFEFRKEFPPSYPFQEDTLKGSCYLRTRCPAWCDRILLSKSAKSLVNMEYSQSDVVPVQYQLIGSDAAMGDHKPVMLRFRLKHDTDSTEICDSISLPSQSSKLHLTLASIPVNTDTSTQFIHVKYSNTLVRVFRETSV